MKVSVIYIYDSIYVVPCCGVVGRVPAFQPCSSGLIPGWVRDFLYHYPGTGFVSIVYVLSCVVSDRGTDILLTPSSPPLVSLSSVVFYFPLLLPQANPEGRKSHSG